MRYFFYMFLARRFPAAATVILGLIVFALCAIVAHNLWVGEQHEKREGDYRWIDHR